MKFLLDKWTSLLYSSILILVPWEKIRGSEFSDLLNYSIRYENIINYGVDYFYWDSTFVGLLKFEILWFKILSLAANVNLEATVFLKSMTFLCAYVIHNYLKKYLGAWWSLIVLLNPITIDLLSSQLRSALAFSLFILVVEGLREKKHIILILAFLSILPFIHNLMVYVVFWYFISLGTAAIKKYDIVIKIIAIIVSSVIFAIIAAALVPELAASIGDRRNFSEYQTKSAAYLSFWILLGTLFVLGKNGNVNYKWEYYFCVAICLSGVLIEIMGLPGFRFIAISIPIIFSIIPFLAKKARVIVATITPVYGILLLSYWML